MSKVVMGRAPSGQALVASDQAPAGLHPSGFDPSRIDLPTLAAMLAIEEAAYATIDITWDWDGHNLQRDRVQMLREVQAIATEAQRAETPQSGSVHEGAGRKASPKPDDQSTLEQEGRG